MSESTKRTTFFLVLGPVLAGLVYWLLDWAAQDANVCWTAAITMLCAAWWITEPIPIPATSLIPLAAFPVLGILSPEEVGASYGSPLVLLLMGGFILSTAMASSGAHRRVALTMVNLFGGNSSRRLVFGFMAASAMISMWISNTATVLMLLPVVLAVLERSEDRKLDVPLLLGIAYAASIGGIGTPIGTPPNLIFREVYFENTGIEIGFLTWMTWGVPVVLLMTPIAAIWLTRKLTFKGSFEMPIVGQWTPYERRVFILFAMTAFAWVTRSQPFGGWSALFGVPEASDASVALFAVIAMFLVPNGKGGRLLDWETANNIPWGMLILFGGGIAIAKAFVTSGLTTTLGEIFSGIAGWPIVFMVASICLAITFLTEITSNTATTTLMMPILAAAALAAGIPPEILMLPAAMSASCAFMLPVATAPNAIVFGTGRVATSAMAREGFVLSLLGAAVITLVCMVML